MHVDGSNRGILELDLTAVLGNDEEKKALGMVKSLDLSKNELSVISNLQPLTALTSLDVHSNRISKLVGLPLGLTKLNVSHNSLTTLEGIAALPFLTELNISYNRIVSLSGLPRMAPITVFDASHNRIASLSGIEMLTKLQVFHLDHNYLCTADDVKLLGRVPTIKTLSLRSCPITELGDYVAIIKSLCPNLVALDGSSLRMGSSGPPKFLQAVAAQERVTEPDSAPRPPSAQASDTSGASSKVAGYGGQAHGNQDTHDLSFDNLVSRAESRRNDIAEQYKRLEREHHDTLLLLEQERRECSLIHGKNQKLEQQLSEARRVLSDELHQVATLRENVNRLEEQLAMQKARADKAVRDLKYAQQKLRIHETKTTAELEKLAVHHEATVHQLQERFRSNVVATKRVIQQDKSLEGEVEELRRTVTKLTTQNQSLSMDLRRLENELHNQSTSAERERRSSLQQPSAAVGASARSAPRQRAINGRAQLSAPAGTGQMDWGGEGGDEDDEEDEFAGSPPHRLRPDVVESDEETYFDSNPYRPTPVPGPSPTAASRAGGPQAPSNPRLALVEHPQSDSRPHYHPRSSTHADGPEGSMISPANTSAVDFAHQLKSWLLSEIESQRNHDGGSPSSGGVGVDPFPRSPKQAEEVVEEDPYTNRGSPRRAPATNSRAHRKDPPGGNGPVAGPARRM